MSIELSFKKKCGNCVCGKKLSVNHILSCRRLRCRFVRHDVIVELLLNLCRRAGFIVQKEVMNVPGRQKRMDIVIYTVAGKIWIDVSIVNHMAITYKNSKNPCKDRETTKHAKWDKHAMPSDPPVSEFD